MNNPQPAFELPQEDYQLLYNIATQKSAIGDYPAAIKILNFLVLAVPGEQVKYLKALAGCLHHQENFAEAIHFYLRSYFAESDANADCLLFTTDCLMKLNRVQEAHETLALLLKEYGTNPDYAQLMVKAKLLHRVTANKLQTATIT